MRLIIGAYLPSCRVNKHLFTRQSGGMWATHPAAVPITFIHPAMMNETGSRVIQAFSDVDKPFLFSDLVIKAAKSEN